MSWHRDTPAKMRIVQIYLLVLTIRTALQFLMKFWQFTEIGERKLNLHEYEPQLARKTIVHPAQNRQYSSNGGGTHPRGRPTGVGLTRRHVAVPWGVNSITNSSRNNAQSDKSAIAVSELVQSVVSVRSLHQLDDESSEAHCAFCNQP